MKQPKVFKDINNMRQSGNPIDGLPKNELKVLADLVNHEGFEVLARMTEQWLRGDNFDGIMRNLDAPVEEKISLAYGSTLGARKVIDFVKLAHDKLHPIDKKK